jgi:pimeloyl-ACP methyl ester carboxylesterase
MKTAPHRTGVTSQTPARNHLQRPGTRVITTAAVLSVALAGLAFVAGGPAEPAAASVRTTAATAGASPSSPPAEARLVDRVPAPVLHWATCRKTAQCATAELPLDYAHPNGAKIKVALLRIKAKDSRHRIGTLFVNPGGPGGSARDFAFSVHTPPALPKSILDRFDIVGVDPRGVGGSTQIRCFSSKAQQRRTMAPFAAMPFPDTRGEQGSYIRAAQALGRACSITAPQLASAMSTTEDARDMDVLRRAVGDRKLTFYGDSYGSYLGEVYANMFPGRVRAVAIDGIVDPQALVGTPATAGVPVLDRIGSAAASYRALHKLLQLCQQAGRPRCSFADADTTARFARLAARLRAHPLRLAAPGIKAATFRYANLIADTGQWLRLPGGYRGLFPELTDLVRLTVPGGSGPGRSAALRRLLQPRHAIAAPPGFGALLQSESGVLCTDGLQGASAASWPAAAAAADRRARYFGADFAWGSAQCARNTWTVQDQNVYRGPFDRRTSAPVLVVGARWDPATSYGSAVKVARLLPNSRLVSSDNWGHTSLETSACVDNAVFGYLIHPLAPAPKVTHCRGDIQPFAPSPASR